MYRSPMTKFPVDRLRAESSRSHYTLDFRWSSAGDQLRSLGRSGRKFVPLDAALGKQVEKGRPPGADVQVGSERIFSRLTPDSSVAESGTVSCWLSRRIDAGQSASHARWARYLSTNERKTAEITHPNEPSPPGAAGKHLGSEDLDPGEPLSEGGRLRTDSPGEICQRQVRAPELQQLVGCRCGRDLRK